MKRLRTTEDYVYSPIGTRVALEPGARVWTKIAGDTWQSTKNVYASDEQMSARSLHEAVAEPRKYADIEPVNKEGKTGIKLFRERIQHAHELIAATYLAYLDGE